MTTHCPICAKTISVMPCPHCLATERRRHGRLVELRGEVLDVQSRLSAHLSGLVEPAEAVQKIHAASSLLLEVAQILKEETRGKGKPNG